MPCPLMVSLAVQFRIVHDPNVTTPVLMFDSAVQSTRAHTSPALMPTPLPRVEQLLARAPVPIRRPALALPVSNSRSNRLFNALVADTPSFFQSRTVPLQMRRLLCVPDTNTPL